jgi:hypothetical protein
VAVAEHFGGLNQIRSNMPNTQEFGDIYLSAFLKLRGWQLAACRREEKRVYFIFIVPADEEMKELPQRFYEGNEVVRITKFLESLQTIKKMSYNLKEG